MCDMETEESVDESDPSENKRRIFNALLESVNIVEPFKNHNIKEHFSLILNKPRPVYLEDFFILDNFGTELASIGAKTGFIWDIGPTISLATVGKVLTNLKSLGCMPEHVKILSLESDICIINVHSYQTKHMDDIILVDVTHGLLNGPQVISDKWRCSITSMIDIVDETINACSDDVVVLNIDNKMCVPTLFGLFAGYPIIYWYTPNEALVSDTLTTENCLADIPLTIFQLMYRDVIVYSVSCPDRILQNDNECLLKKTIKWFDRVSAKINNNDVQFKIIHKTMSSVVL